MCTTLRLVDDQFVDMDNLWTLQHGDDSWTIAGKLKCARSFHGSITFRGIVSSFDPIWRFLPCTRLAGMIMHETWYNLKLDGTTSFVGEDDFILIGGTKNRSCNGEHISLRADKKSLNVINIDRLTKRSGKRNLGSSLLESRMATRTFLPQDHLLSRPSTFYIRYRIFQYSKIVSAVLSTYQTHEEDQIPPEHDNDSAIVIQSCTLVLFLAVFELWVRVSGVKLNGILLAFFCLFKYSKSLSVRHQLPSVSQ